MRRRSRARHSPADRSATSQSCSPSPWPAHRAEEPRAQPGRGHRPWASWLSSDGTESSGGWAGIGVAAGGQQHGAAVEFELPGSAGAESLRGQHGGQRGSRIVGVMAVPERVPLAVRTIVSSEWYCSSSTPPGATRDTRSASAADWSAACISPKQSSTTSAGSPGGTGVSPRLASNSSQEPPCGLPYSATRRPSASNPAAATRATASAACSTERGRLSPPRLLGHGRVGHQLGQAAG